MFHLDLNSGAVIAIVFWLFVAAVSITPIIVGYKMRKATLDTMRAAIDKGQALPPEMLKQLSGLGASMGGDQKVSSVNLKIGGAITMASGVGTAIIATIFWFTLPVAAPYVYAGAGLTFCIGVGLFYAAKIMREHELEEKSNTSNAQ